MHKSLKGFSILNTVFNIRAGEWPRVVTAWVIRLLYRTSFVIAWTVVIGIFVSRYGIYYLPYLFVINAIFTILGSVFYSTFFDRFSLGTIMFGTVVSACALFLSAHFFGSESQILFFTLLLVAISVFLMQLRVVLETYVEELFSPLESERTFPFVESAETFGGIAAGLLLTLLIGDIETTGFIYLLVGLLIMMLPVVLVYRVFSSRRRLSKGVVHKHMGAFEAWSKLKTGQFPTTLKTYLKGIVLIVMLHYMLYNLIEFQYTKAVYQNASNIILEAGSGFEHAIVHDLGKLFVLFSSLALLVQLFIGSRLINSLGIVGSMMVHPIVTILSLFGLFFSFSFSTAILAKNNYTLTSVIYLNAYHSSYYAIPENMRSHAREILVGVVRPIGAILGAGFLILVQRLFISSTSVIFSVNVVMMTAAVLLLIVTYRHQKKYTNVALALLKKSSSKVERFHAIEILAQRGHECGTDVLTKLVFNKSEKTSMRVKAVSALVGMKDISMIPTFLQFLNFGNPDIRQATLTGLSTFPRLGKKLSASPILERDLVYTLRSLFKSEKSFDLRNKILVLLSNLSTLSAVDFLLDVVNDSSGPLKANAILSLAEYSDPAICDHIRPYLRSKSWDVRSSALVALMRCKDSKLDFDSEVKPIFAGKSKDAMIASMRVVGELRLSAHKKLCLRLSHSHDSDVKIASIIALVKLDDSRVTPLVLELAFSSNFDVASKVKGLIESVDSSFARYILGYINHSAVQKLHLLLDSHGALKSKKRLSKDVLGTLRNLYFLSNDYDEVDDVTTLLLEF